MKKLLTAGALCAVMAFAGSAFARDWEMDKADMMKARWAFYNADEREVKRFKAKGFSESDFKAIANIALRTGLDTDYIGRQVKEVGRPLSFVAAMYGVPTTALSADIPGFNAAPGVITPTGKMVPTTTSSMSSTTTSGSSSQAPMSPATPETPATP